MSFLSPFDALPGNPIPEAARISSEFDTACA
jgi:hypothetical protein